MTSPCAAVWLLPDIGERQWASQPGRAMFIDFQRTSLAALGLVRGKALMAKGPEEGEEEEASAPDPTPAQPKLAKKGNTIPGT